MIRNSDYIQQLANYFKKNLFKGYTLESLKWALINQGHSRTEVERAIKFANEQLALSAPKLIEKPIIKYGVVTNNNLVLEKKSFWKKLKDFIFG